MVAFMHIVTYGAFPFHRFVSISRKVKWGTLPQAEAMKNFFLEINVLDGVVQSSGN